MSVKKQEVFQKLSPSDKETVINDLIATAEPLMVKGDFSDNPSFLIPAHIENDFVLICKISSEGHPIPITFVGDELQKVVITFLLKKERYVIRTELTHDSGQVIVNLNADVFRLQRRSSARIDIPEGIKAGFIFREYKTKKYELNCVLKDISAGGVKVEILQGGPVLNLGDLVKGAVILGMRRPIEFELETRFVQKIIIPAGRPLYVGHDPQPTENQLVGLRFLKLNPVMESRVLTTLMDFQAELKMLKRKNKT